VRRKMMFDSILSDFVGGCVFFGFCDLGFEQHLFSGFGD
jgi:hypothetical protein